MKYIFICWVLLTAFNSYGRDENADLKIKEISPNVYLHTSYKNVEGYGLVGSNGLVVIESNNAFIIDTPWTNDDTKRLVAWIKDKGYKVLGSLSTHSHDDRSGGIKWLNNNAIPTYASQRTNRILAQNGKSLATHTFTDSVFEIESGLMEVFYPGGGHTVDNVVVWLPKAKILAGGCFTKSLHSKNLGYVGEALIEQWPSSIDKVLSKYPEAKMIVPGHGKLGDVRLLLHTQKLAKSASFNK
jgi:metallo-beta-lactamase class B/metallo-beta-lactamase class B GIM